MENKAREKKIFKQDPASQYYVEIEDMQSSVEGIYFWFLDFLKGDFPTGIGFKQIEKIRDVYSASEASSFFGNIEQRKSIQQDRVSQFMATVGRMVKDLFQIVRELRIIDERLEHYNATKDQEPGKWSATAKAADEVLKDLWITMVEGGTERPTSVYGMAQKVNFVTLPDLFFATKVSSKEEIDKEVKHIKHINTNVKRALSRKLFQFIEWKNSTWKEIETRRKFLVKYLKQHYHTIRMYMAWIKPYLRNIRKLQMSSEERPELVTSFETTYLELELLAIQDELPTEEDKINKAIQEEKSYACILVQLDHVTRPFLAFQNDQSRGAAHAGKVIMRMKTYALKYDQIQEYKKAVEMEDFEVIESVKEAMEALSDDLDHYLNEEEGVTFDKMKLDKLNEILDTNLNTAEMKKLFKDIGLEEFMDKVADKELKSKDMKEIEKKFAEKFNEKLGTKLNPKQVKDMLFKIGLREKKGQDSAFEPFKAAYSGFSGMFKSEKKTSDWDKGASYNKARGIAKSRAFTVYDIFKKVHQLLAW